MYDLIIKGGRIADGSRLPIYASDICIKDGKIAEITREQRESRETLDASGKIVAPGFIDLHSHSDSQPFVSYDAESKLAQGVTLELVGNCGGSRLLRGDDPVSTMTGYKAEAENRGILTNFAALVGHGTLRGKVLGASAREPSEAELESMKELLDRELSAGAFGMSLGLIYPPSAFGHGRELTELAKVVAAHDGILAVHMRNESAKVLDSIDEMIGIARQSGVHVQISHFKVCGAAQWGMSDAICRKVEEARAEGLNFTCDQYPYTASSTGLTSICPIWAHDGGRKALQARLENADEGLIREIAGLIASRGGAKAILCVSASGHPEYSARYLSDIAAEFGLDDVHAAIKVLIDTNCSCSCIYFTINEDDVVNIMRRLYISVGTDGSSYSFDEQFTPGNPHPRNFGTYPRFFRYVREKQLMPIEDAVYKVSGLPASIISLKDRGLIREGYVADLTVFDPDTIADRNDYTCSKVRPDGIDYVVVGGVVTYSGNAVCGPRNGKVLLHGID